MAELTAVVAAMAGRYGGGGGYGGGATAGRLGRRLAGWSTAGGGYGSQNSFSSGFGGTGGACGTSGGMGGGMGGMGGGYGYPSFGGYSAQTWRPPRVAGPPEAHLPARHYGRGSARRCRGGSSQRPPRIVANPLDNSLLIQADAQQYQGILKLLKELDVTPRQILLEAKIYSVIMSGSFAMGVNYYFQQVSGQQRKPLASLVSSRDAAVGGNAGRPSQGTAGVLKPVG